MKYSAELVNIPVEFERNGQQMRGLLSYSPGMGEHAWFLSVNNYYWGTLVIRQGEFVFLPGPKNEDMKDMGENFGNYITSFYQ